MKNIILSTTIILTSLASISAQTAYKKGNELVSFLEGKWHNYSYMVADSTPVIKQNYKETMLIKNDSTIIITAHNYIDDKDITRDMILVTDGEKAYMQQGDFRATGIRQGNVYYLKGYAGGKEYRFRLYTMGDKYIFHNEVWSEGKIEMINMSYLVRE